MTVQHCKIPVGLALALREAGISERAVLSRASLPARLFVDHIQYVPAADYFALWRAIRDVSENPNIGIELATRVRPDVTEPLFLALMSAADVADALRMVSAFKRALEPEDVHIVPDERHRRIVVTYEWPDKVASPPQVLTDAELAFIVNVCRKGTGDANLKPREIRLKARTLEPRATHRAFFGCDIRFGKTHNAVVFSTDDMARPFVTFNPQLTAALVPYLRAKTPARTPTTSARVRAVLAEQLKGRRPDVATVGKQLAMSARTLQRQLRNEGVSFREVLDRVRNEHAQAYLRGSSFSDGEISFLLGFEDPNSFQRAFKAWNGSSPNRARRAIHRQ